MNTERLNEISKKMDDYFNSPQAKIDIENWAKKIAFKEELEQKYHNKLINLYKSKKDNFYKLLDKIINKYNSDEYVRREYKIGREPMNILLDYFYPVFKELGAITQDEKYSSMFDDGAYILDNYVARMLFGQGTVTQIMKID